MMIQNKTPRGNCVTLDKIIGISSKHNNSISVNPLTSEIAYIASGVISFFSPSSNKQEYYIFNQNSKVFSCLSFSSNGKYLATGEGTCKQPEIAIWDLSTAKQPILVKRLKGHKYGIEWVVFSPDCSHLVSIGNEHDMGLFVWNWSQEKRVSSNKITKRILTISFSPSGDFFVTGGVKNIKMWNFDKGRPVTTASSSTAEVKCMASKNFDLAEMKEKTFCSVAVGKESVFALTSEGFLCVFTAERAMDKWMDLHVGNGYVLTTSGKYLVCGCADGIIRCFDSNTMSHIVTLPRPPPLGQANISPDKKRIMIASEPNSVFADTVGLLLLENNSKLYALYSDRTVFTWDISRLEAITVYRASLHHSAAINDIQILPSSTMEVTKFVTASSDKTIRFWHLCHSDPLRLDTEVIKNVYSREMSRIIYVTNNFEHFKQKTPEGEGCVKCVACSPNGRHVASGDSEGVLRVHSVDTLEELLSMQAHDSDIVSIDFNMHTPREGENDSKARMLLASGSRDRLIHIFDAGLEYRHVLTIDDHNSSVSDLTFVRVDGTDKLISCGADRSLVFRNILGQNAVRYFQTIQKTKKCYSIKPHPIHKTIVIGEDKCLKVLLMESGKLVKEIEDYQEKGVKAVSDSNLKIAMDASGLILAVCNLDRTVRLIEYYSGKVLGKLNVGDTVTSLAFSPNGKKLLTTTNDGCIFIWRLSIDLTNAIRARMARAPVARPLEEIEDLPDRPRPVQEDMKKELEKILDEPRIISHESILPTWAKADPSHAVKKSPFEYADEPSSGKWKKAPVKFEVEDIISEPQKIEVFKTIEEIDSEDEKREEESPGLLTPMPKVRENFVLTKSMMGNKNVFGDLRENNRDVVEDEEVKEETVNDEAFIDNTEEESEEEKLPELEDDMFVKNPMRQSLSASFWQQKQEHIPEKVGFFDYEPTPVVTEPWHMPKIIDLKKKKEVVDVQLKISDMKKQLQDIGVLSMPKKVKTPANKPVENKKSTWSEPEIPEIPEIIADPDSEIPEEIEGNEEILEEISDKEESPQSVKEKEKEKEEEEEEEKVNVKEKVKEKEKEKDKDKILKVVVNTVGSVERFESSPKKFDSPYTKNDLADSTSLVGFSISESHFSHSVKLTKDQYKQGFSDLKRSLQDVHGYFSGIDTADPDYSVSFEESYQDRKEIIDLLIGISGKIGEQLMSSREDELIEKFSRKLVSTYQNKIRQIEKEKNIPNERDREQDIE